MPTGRPGSSRFPSRATRWASSGAKPGGVALVGGSGPIGLLTAAVLNGMGAGGTVADVAFECTGVNAVLDTMLDAVRPAGVVVDVSIWGAPATVDMQKLVLTEIDLRGTIAYVRDHPAVIKMVQEGKVDLKPFITGRIALDDLVEQGFDTLINHKDTA